MVTAVTAGNFSIYLHKYIQCAWCKYIIEDKINSIPGFEVIKQKWLLLFLADDSDHEQDEKKWGKEKETSGTS